MFSLFRDIYNYFFKTDTSERDREDEEIFLSQQLIDLEVETINTKNEHNVENICDQRTTHCFERTGTITYMGDKYALIDGSLYLDLQECSAPFKINDQITYLCYEYSNGFVKVIRCIQNLGRGWGDPDTDEKQFDILNHTLVAQVGLRKDRLVFLKDSDVKFSLDDVNATFVPIKGDWLELYCQVQWNESSPTNISLQQVVQVISIQPLRKKICCATVTQWDSECGVCDRDIFFNKQSLQNGFLPFVGSKVVVEAIESDQGPCNWRSIKLLTDNSYSTSIIDSANEGQKDIDTFDIEELNKLQISYPLLFEQVNFNERASLVVDIINNSEHVHFLHRWKVLSRKQDSQLIVEPFIKRAIRIYPGKKYVLNVTCTPKFLGKSKEVLTLQFKGFEVRRSIEMNIVLHNENVIHDNIVSRENKSYRQQIQCMDKIRKNAVKSFIPGVKPKTCPAFLNKRLGLFPIPDKVWNAVLGNADEVVFTDDYKKALYRIETLLPGLLADININNYNDKWHTLLYMEEVQQNISMRSYDMPKVFLDRYQDYLSINIHGLSERRPSLIKGDKVLLKDIWNSDAPHYEGFIHSIVGDTVLMKFSPKFHEVYSGYDVSLEFHFSRTVYRRCHQAVNMAIECLGPDVLFPSRILISNCQVDNTKLNTIEWCNPSLNKGQKTAISNILAGECRPLPYCIFGPPGTGKTITIVETIVQILKHFPESRILVATPSNSASNILTERLIQYRNKFSGSISRIIAFYLLDSDALPDSIKPYCSTIDISKEDSQKNNQQKLENGINLNCQARFIARYRVVIGTCISLGVLGHLGLPKGHFTHIIVDEAGQATEPEIMIPLSFIDKNNGQIILAGDPLQLGPVVLSNYCKEYGLNESYFQRILQRFPYQKDTDAFQDQGFDRRLVSLLTENYRSLEEVLHMPNNIFYDGQLISNLTLTEWVVNLINILSEIFSSTEKRGGIFIYGIKGQNARAIDSPSWYNPQEAAMVLFFVCKLYKKKVTPDQIGIITPYIAQIKYLRQIFISIGCPLPKIGTVEEFQGQERPIIVLSTVRSTEALIHYDVKQFLGFVNSPKRINVALTRAQVATVIFCNPYVLSKDSLWKRVIEYAVQNNNYTGCDLPTDINHELI